jgi:hypothetical protein
LQQCHKQADAFNRVQRGHQSIFVFESLGLGCFIPATLRLDYVLQNNEFVVSNV